MEEFLQPSPLLKKWGKAESKGRQPGILVTLGHTIISFMAATGKTEDTRHRLRERLNGWPSMEST